MSQSWASYHQRLADKYFLPSGRRCRTDPYELTRKRRFALAAGHPVKNTSVPASPGILKPQSFNPTAEMVLPLQRHNRRMIKQHPLVEVCPGSYGAGLEVHGALPAGVRLPLVSF
jgi:transketolase N-terminal domain/subunit